jgi:hypothetical protein
MVLNDRQGLLGERLNCRVLTIVISCRSNGSAFSWGRT